MPSNIEKFQVIIRADRALQTEHRGRYNAHQIGKVAILIVGQEFTKWDIVWPCPSIRHRDQTKVAGLHITNPCSTHEQFDVACSHVSSAKNLYVYVDHQRTKNIIYKEVL